MPLYFCRWATGDLSAVFARDREDAINQLDEVGNAELCELFTVQNFMVHFSLKEKAAGPDDILPVELKGFGEQTLEMLFDRVYPIYNRVLSEVDGDLPLSSDNVLAEQRYTVACDALNQALTTERNRLRGIKKPVISNDPEAARLQALGPDVPKNIAERLVKECSEKRVEEAAEMPPQTDKLQ